MYLCVWLGGTDANLKGVGKYLLVFAKCCHGLFCVVMTEYSRLGAFRGQMAGCFLSKVTLFLMAPESRLQDTIASVKTVVSSGKSKLCLATAFGGAKAERDAVLCRRCPAC